MPFGRNEVRRSPDWLIARPFAHRGLHGGRIVENSRAAFEAAIAEGFGIELDVQASRCGTPFVFHDTELNRLCGRAGSLAALDRAEIEALRLSDTTEAIPTLDAILALVGCCAPLLIEIKADGRVHRGMCGTIAASLASYSGPAAIMSFHPGVVRWFRRHAPQVIRGLVVSEENSNFSDLAFLRLAVRWAKPDFLAYDVQSLPSSLARAARARGLPILTWTVRTAEDRKRAEVNADQIIFERT